MHICIRIKMIHAKHTSQIENHKNEIKIKETNLFSNIGDALHVKIRSNTRSAKICSARLTALLDMKHDTASL